LGTEACATAFHDESSSADASRLQSCKVTQLAPLQRHYNAWPCSCLAARSLFRRHQRGDEDLVWLFSADQPRLPHGRDEHFPSYIAARCPTATSSTPTANTTTWARHSRRDDLVQRRLRRYPHQHLQLQQRGIDLIKAYESKWSCFVQSNAYNSLHEVTASRKTRWATGPRTPTTALVGSPARNFHPGLTTTNLYDTNGFLSKTIEPRNHPNEFIHVHQWPRLDAYRRARPLHDESAGCHWSAFER